MTQATKKELDALSGKHPFEYGVDNTNPAGNSLQEKNFRTGLTDVLERMMIEGKQTIGDTHMYQQKPSPAPMPNQMDDDEDYTSDVVRR